MNTFLLTFFIIGLRLPVEVRLENKAQPRQTIEAHGGRVDAESVPGRGTEIRMLLPSTPIASPEAS